RHQRPLPFAIARGCQMLHRATAANAEMRADRGDPLGACDLDSDEMATVGMAWPGADLHALARQAVGHIERACGSFGNAIAMRAKSRNGQAVEHGPSIAIGRCQVQEPRRQPPKGASPRRVSASKRQVSSTAKLATPSENPIQTPIAPRPAGNASA